MIKAVWKIHRLSADKGLMRFKHGHPWLYSNDIDFKAWDRKEFDAFQNGSVVKLVDLDNKFLGLGFGNKNSKIAFRCLTRDEQVTDATSVEQISSKLKKAARVRQLAGFNNRVSHRTCYGEVDGIPGLCIERFFVSDSDEQVLVAQPTSAGADNLCQPDANLLPALRDLVSRDHPIEQSDDIWAKTSVIINRRSGSRTLENMQTEKPTLLKESILNKEIEIFNSIKLKFRGILSPDAIDMHADLFTGQKTGFFFDQFANMQLVAQLANNDFWLQSCDAKSVRILDLCSYVGQWGVQLGNMLQKQKGMKAHVTAVDISKAALSLASKNYGIHGIEHETVIGDVASNFDALKKRDFDIVICDPPAFVKTRKDINSGTRAYAKLIEKSLRLVRSGGIYFFSSCSGILDSDLFTHTINKGTHLSQRSVSWVAAGTQSPDHPIAPAFPEATYLKSRVGFVL